MDTIEISLILNDIDIFKLQILRSKISNLVSPSGHTFADVLEFSRAGNLIIKISYPRYFIFDCKYEYYHNTMKSYNKLMIEEFLELSIKINLYSNFGNYYIKFSDLFSCFNNELMTLMSFNDYSELKLYELHRDVKDLAKYFEINFGIEVRKD